MDKALLTIDAFDSGFGVPQNFTDPKAPSSQQSVILQPSEKATGGMKVVREPEAAKEAEGYTAGG
ncbi:ABC transporter substrate-binding protein OS=Streptomyces alboniger OX=132473 GN=CP975_29910 PE=3 SV=1 [Streptomyces alboniger]